MPLPLGSQLASRTASQQGTSRHNVALHAPPNFAFLSSSIPFLFSFAACLLGSLVLTSTRPYVHVPFPPGLCNCIPPTSIISGLPPLAWFVNILDRLSYYILFPSFHLPPPPVCILPPPLFSLFPPSLLPSAPPPFVAPASPPVSVPLVTPRLSLHHFASSCAPSLFLFCADCLPCAALPCATLCCTVLFGVFIRSCIIIPRPLVISPPPPPRSADGQIRVWSLASRRCNIAQNAHSGKAIIGLEFLSDDRLLSQGRDVRGVSHVCAFLSVLHVSIVIARFASMHAISHRIWNRTLSYQSLPLSPNSTCCFIPA